MAEELFLVTIYSNPKAQRLLRRPVTMISYNEHRFVKLIENPVIPCDVRGYKVAMGDSECIIKDCRQKCFGHLRVRRDLDQALGGGGS